jgi:hypothetical protein
MKDRLRKPWCLGSEARKSRRAAACSAVVIKPTAEKNRDGTARNTPNVTGFSVYFYSKDKNMS